MEEFCSPLHSRTYKVKLICKCEPGISLFLLKTKCRQNLVFAKACRFAITAHRAPSLMGLPGTSAPCRDTVSAIRLFVFDE